MFLILFELLSVKFRLVQLFESYFILSAPKVFEESLCTRVDQLLKLIVEFTPKNGRSSSMSVAPEARINTSRFEFMNKLECHPLFFEVAIISPDDLVADSTRLAIRVFLTMLIAP
jgi:hypothetical protein